MTGQTLPPLRSSHQWHTAAGPLSYDTWGVHGRPVLLIPAVLFDRAMWWPIGADLRPQATVIAVDLPGHAASSPRARYDPYALVDDLAALIAHLDLRQAPVIVGHGTSAGLAALFATRYATHAVVTVDPDSTVPADARHYLRHMRPDALPGRYRALLTPATDTTLLHDYTACIQAWPAAGTQPASPHARLAVHSRPPRGPDRRPGWRHMSYDVPARFAHLADVDRFVHDVSSLLTSPGTAARHEDRS